MKKLILSLLASFVAVSSVFGQAVIGYGYNANRTSGLVSYSLDGLTSTPFPRAAMSTIPDGSGAYSGQLLNVDFFAASLGTPLQRTGPLNTPDFTSWTYIGMDFHRITVIPGRMSVDVFLPASFAAGADVQFEVVGWTGTATTWAQALIDDTGLFGFCGETFNGAQLGGLGWDQPTGNFTIVPPTPPGIIPLGPNGYAGLVLEPDPEPATITLGGLAAATLLFFRRRLQL